MIDRRLLGGALSLALLLAACGSSNASPSPSASAAAPVTAPPSSESAAPSESAASSESQAPADTSSAGANASNAPEISLSAGQAADLEAMLPGSIGSTQLVKSSFDGAQIPASGTPIDQSSLDPVLKKYNKSISDVRFAMAVPAGGASETNLEAVYAVQLKGVPASQFMKDVSGMDISTSSTIGGKTVYGASATPSGDPFVSYVYPKDDILFVILSNPTDAAGIISSLP